MAIVASPASSPRTSHPSTFTLALIGVAAGVVGLALAYGLNTVRTPTAASGGVDHQLVRTIGGRDVTVPASWFRSDGDRAEGVTSEVDLSMSLPVGQGGQLRSIEVTLMPRSKVAPTSLLLDSVYLHQFDQRQLSGPEGLIGKPLISEAGNEGETVWYDALSADPFVAKCAAPVAEGLTSRCLRAVYLGTGLAAVYSFDADLLSNWKLFDGEIKPIMSKIGAL
jgi:hypothetical protein